MANYFFNSDGWKYLKTGDEIGHLCLDCGSALFIDKTGKKWTIRCHCGREIHFSHHFTEREISDNYFCHEEDMVDTVYL